MPQQFVVLPASSSPPILTGTFSLQVTSSSPRESGSNISLSRYPLLSWEAGGTQADLWIDPSLGLEKGSIWERWSVGRWEVTGL